MGDENTSRALSAAIRFARTSRKLTQVQFAAKLGHGRQGDVSRLESGAALYETSIERVAETFGITVRQLLREWLEGTCDECGAAVEIRVEFVGHNGQAHLCPACADRLCPSAAAGEP